ncbi:hypothetical protein P700755_000367 [Psychroflexus torquis ATCC 700755]|uniref:Uncharacterized protein n=1 Tax=Psychroflexus torquis (strain ATCC 700755 / CIP 106069 / ACAM 623) TaxID=313595 RepID=K4IBV9_PSYTT|nr:hypothetical protein [Psychroflexus torquis]AFU67398.1 hypothetical protein P700755_000367 [Psychroflexus torquis ATCC 700755]
MINTKRQAIYTAFIIIGAGLLIFDLIDTDDNVFIKIGGLVILMVGLYNSTKQWTRDNPKDNEESSEDEQ